MYTATTNLNFFKKFKSIIATQDLGAFFSAMLGVKSGRPLVNWFVKAFRLMEGRLSNGTVRVTIVYVNKCYRMRKNSGIKFLTLYLKNQSVNLMQAVAGTSNNDLTSLGIRFARTKSSGKQLPRIIPILHRKQIRNNSFYHIKLWQTLFNLYRVLEFTNTLKLSTIVDPSGAQFNLYDYQQFSYIFFKQLLRLTKDRWLNLCFKNREEALKALKVKPFNIASSSSNFSNVISSSYWSILSAIYLWSIDPLSLYLLDYLKMTMNTSFVRFLETGFRIKEWPKEIKRYSKSLGALSFKFEPAKIRVFALVDPITQ